MVKNKNILLAIGLCLPLLIFYAGYLWNHEPGLRPTGFIQYDNVSYIAYAKQYLDADQMHLQYANPYNDRDYTPIYFQPQGLLFALLLKLGIPPGWILIPFTLICSFICFLLLIAIYDHLVPSKKFRTFSLWLFAWGGGLLTLAGMIAHFYLNQKDAFLDGIFVLDPEHGWWGLNFGRALFFSCEAYYHALFLGTVYALLRHRWLMGFILLFLLSLSHPFTGIELILIILSWSCVEFFWQRKNIPAWFIGLVFFAFCFHIYFYLVYLEKFPDHQSVHAQYTLNWRLRFYRMIPAYCLVGALAIVSLISEPVKKFFSFRANRLFTCWFLVAFLLANHEWFMTARQPVHFTRGYIWTSLFLLGLPALQRLNNYLSSRWGKLGLATLAIVFLMDNFLWITNNVYSKASLPYATYMTREQEEVFSILEPLSNNKTLIVSGDANISYLSSVYTEAYPWYSHPFTTPFAENKRMTQNRFLEEGLLDSSWLSRPVNFVLRKTDTAALTKMASLPIQKRINTENYSVFIYRPAP